MDFKKMGIISISANKNSLGNIIYLNDDFLDMAGYSKNDQ